LSVLSNLSNVEDRILRFRHTITAALTTIVAAASLNFTACKDDSGGFPVYEHDTPTYVDNSGSDTSGPGEGITINPDAGPSDDVECEEETVYPDLDGDGYGDKQMNFIGCEPPDDGKTYVDNWYDCYDNPEGRDGILGTADDGININPDAEEICDGLDNNCRDGIDEGLGSEVLICEGSDYAVISDNPLCKNLYQTKFCDPLIGDWNYTVCAPKQISPEECDYIDNDCDGDVDEDFPTLGEICSVGIGACENVGNYVCSGDGSGVECNVSPFDPTPEICDDEDNNCNDKVDEGLSIVCYTGPEGTLGVGQCVSGLEMCVDGAYTSCLGQVLPSDEICDVGYVDENCDGDANMIIYENEPKPFDVLFIIDDSGSMNTNDPNDIRFDGPRGIVNGPWKYGDRASVMIFATSFDIMGPFTPDVPTINQQIDDAEGAYTGGSSQMGTALEEGIELFAFDPIGNYSAIFFLTDGDTTDYVPVTLLNQYAWDSKVAICAYGLGNADVNYLDQLTTGGVGGYTMVTTPAEIVESYIKDFSELTETTKWVCTPAGEWKEYIGVCGGTLQGND
jgi:hypothetical protein